MIDVLDTYIMEKICNNLLEIQDFKTLGALSQTCKTMHQICHPILESYRNYLKRICGLAMIFQDSDMNEYSEPTYYINERIIKIMKEVLELSDIDPYLSTFRESDIDSNTMCLNDDYVLFWLDTAIPFNKVIIRNGRVKNLIKFVLQKYTQYGNLDISLVKKNHSEIFNTSRDESDQFVTNEIKHIQYINDIINCEEATICADDKYDNIRIGDIVSIIMKMKKMDSENSFDLDYDLNIVSCNEGTLILELNNINE